MKISVKLTSRLGVNLISASIINFLCAQSDSANKWQFGIYADTYIGSELLNRNNQEQGISELVSFHRFKELAINSAVARVKFEHS